MVRSALTTIKDYLDGWVKGRIPDYPSVELSSLSKDGSEESGGKIMLTLVHIEEETSNKAQMPSATESRNEGCLSVPDNPELNLCLYVLVSSHHSQYDTALLYISEAVKAFQAKRSFLVGDKSISLDMYQLTLDRNLNLWQTIGSKLMPSVMYKVQVIGVQASPVRDVRIVETLQTGFTRDMTRDGMSPEARKASKAVVETFVYTKHK